MPSQIIMKEVEIEELFDFPSTNSKITKAFCNKNKGEIPVYASSKNEKSVLGFIQDDLKGVKYYENCLSWNRNGSVGYVFIRNHRFATNEDHRAMVIKKEFKRFLSKKYLKYETEKNLMINGFSFLNKCGVDKIKKVTIKIPVKKNGEFDLVKQEELGDKFEKLFELKLNISKSFKNIYNLKIDWDVDCEKTTLSLGDKKYFIVDNGERVRKEDINKAKGNIPFYSSSKFEGETMGFVSDKIKEIVKNAKKFNGKFLTINADGSVGKVFLREGEFYLNDVVNIIKILNNRILYEYLLYELQNKIDILGYGSWDKKLYKTELKQEVFVDIPLNKNKEFDLQKQIEISEKYKKVEEVKKKLKEDFESINSLQIELIR